jgi:hypothetical protein
MPLGYVQQTVVPGATVASLGVKLKSAIVITVSPDGQPVPDGRVTA